MTEEKLNGALNGLSLDKSQEQVVTPWDVTGQVIDGVEVGIDYGKLMGQFGCQPLTPELLARLEKQTGMPVHPLLRRGAFYCHRDLERILDLHAAGKPFYLYTGRGPSSESMHLGHMIPFVFCKYLQDAFKCFLVIQMTDDEKFLFKENLSLEQCKKYAFENSKDIIAVGFDPKLTFIFPDTMYMGTMFEMVVRVQKLISFNTARAVFGFDQNSNIGQIAYPATQIAPCFSEVFPHLFGGRKDVPCLIPYAIDQDPYFRVCRDIAPRLKLQKPASLCSVFFPALQGLHKKMSGSSYESAIFMTDSPKAVQDKINRYAFSGGGATLEEHRQNGANLAVDIPFQYLRFFHSDDDEIKRIEEEYGAGRMMTGEVKKLCGRVLTDFITAFQERRALVTDETVRQFMDFSNNRF